MLRRCRFLTEAVVFIYSGDHQKVETPPGVRPDDSTTVVVKEWADRDGEGDTLKDLSGEESN